MEVSFSSVQLKCRVYFKMWRLGPYWKQKSWICRHFQCMPQGGLEGRQDLEKLSRCKARWASLPPPSHPCPGFRAGTMERRKRWDVLALVVDFSVPPTCHALQWFVSKFFVTAKNHQLWLKYCFSPFTALDIGNIMANKSVILSVFYWMHT